MGMMPTRWDMEADVVVAGYGAAGAVAAITAADAGSQVVVVEKQEAETPFSNSFISGGVFITPNDVQGAITYLEGLYRAGEGVYWTDPEIIRVWAEYTSENKRWFEQLGAKPELIYYGGQHALPGAETIEVYGIPGSGPGFMRVLSQQVAARNIQIARGVEVTNLIPDSRGEIVGITGRHSDGASVSIRARRAVILATGGFEFDEQAKLQYLKLYPCYFYAAPALTGDGIRMALEVGAQLWHMNCCCAGFALKFPEVPVGLRPAFGGSAWRWTVSSGVPQLAPGHEQPKRAHQAPHGGYLVTDRYGRRFLNENYKSHCAYYELSSFDSYKLIYPRVPSYWIFDQRRIEAGPLSPHWRGGPRSRVYKWSSDNGEELERGWIKSAGTIGGLAKELGIEPAVLDDTISSYNRCCDDQCDPSFGREAITLIPLSNPPYYAVTLWPGGLNTLGGPRRNARAEVIGAGGGAIPRLFGAGELGSIYGMLYPNAGGNLAECIAFGRIAGENASACRPR